MGNVTEEQNKDKTTTKLDDKTTKDIMEEKGEEEREREVTTYQTSSKPLTYTWRARRPVPGHSALDPTILTRVVSHSPPEQQPGVYFR